MDKKSHHPTPKHQKHQGWIYFNISFQKGRTSAFFVVVVVHVPIFPAVFRSFQSGIPPCPAASHSPRSTVAFAKEWNGRSHNEKKTHRFDQDFEKRCQIIPTHMSNFTLRMWNLKRFVQKVWNMKLEVCWALMEGGWKQLDLGSTFFLQRKDTGNNNVTNYGKKTVTFR